MKFADYISTGALTVSIFALAINIYLDRYKRLSDRRAEVYLNFLKWFMRSPARIPMTDVEHGEWQAEHLNSKSQVLLYGSKDVVNALLRLYAHEREVNDYRTEEGGKALESLYQAMRRDCQRGALPATAVQQVIVFHGPMDSIEVRGPE